MHQAFKYRVYPTNRQKYYLLRTFGACRYIYNWGLDQKSSQYALTEKSEGLSALCRRLTKLKSDSETEWLNEIPSVCLQQSLRNLEAAYSKFFRGNSRHPRFHVKRACRGSARYTKPGFKLNDGRLFLAKSPDPFKVVWSRTLPCKPNSCTISITPSGEFYVSFLCDISPKTLPKTTSRVGLDVGITDFVVTSHCEKFKQPESIRRARVKLIKLNRRLSKKKKGSRNREKARIKVARAFEKISNIRHDFLHKLSTSLVYENQVIVMEDLHVKCMLKNSNLSRAISEQGWRDFRIMLTYKSEWYGRQLIICNRFFPSSKTCSSCGKIRGHLPIRLREWVCSCGATHDRDINAAINILAAGTVVSACGEDGRPKVNYFRRGRSSMKQESSSFTGK